MPASVAATMESTMPAVGWKPSPETRAKWSAVRRGRKHTAETIAKMSAAHAGRIPANIVIFQEAGRVANIGRPLRPEHRAKVVRTLDPHNRRGKPLTAAHKARLAQAMKGNTRTRDASVKGECVYCGEPGTSYDHIIPLSRGGPDIAENMVVACLVCNSTKHDRTPDEWLAAIMRDAS